MKVYFHCYIVFYLLFSFSFSNSNISMEDTFKITSQLIIQTKINWEKAHLELINDHSNYLALKTCQEIKTLSFRKKKVPFLCGENNPKSNIELYLNQAKVRKYSDKFKIGTSLNHLKQGAHIVFYLKDNRPIIVINPIAIKKDKINFSIPLLQISKFIQFPL